MQTHIRITLTDTQAHTMFSVWTLQIHPKEKIRIEDPILFAGKLEWPNIWNQNNDKYQWSIPHLIHITHSQSLYFSSLSLISQFWQSHQLLHPKVTANTQRVQTKLPCVMESKMKKFSDFISRFHPKQTSWEIKLMKKLSNSPKQTSWEIKSEKHQHISMNSWFFHFTM